jgi:probable HAF family extracellular repeat protein
MTSFITLFARLARYLLVVGATVAMLVISAGPVPAAAQEHHHYKLIDLGTFGGPASYISNGLNNSGTAVGVADTPTPDPTCYVDCFVAHAFQSRNGGALVDLGALPGGASSQAFLISANGLIAGVSQIAEIDPSLPGGAPELRAVLWRNGVPTDLGMLPQGGFDTQASAVNSRGEVVGFGLDTTADPFSLIAPGFATTQTRAFLWKNGAMQDLGTLGGADAQAVLVNERGQIAGMSYTNSTPNPVTGLPTQDPFLWENGMMVDLGTLGGTFSLTSALNNRGEVVGQSNLAGDPGCPNSCQTHPFLWTKTGGMQDLGTLGGNNGITNWINDAGAIAGKADLPGPLPQNHDAVLWRQGSMIDLGTLPGDSCSNAYYVNSRGQVVGTSENSALCRIPTGEHAFLWEGGGPMVDLNSLIAPGSNLELTFALAINDSGEIVGTGVPSGCTNICDHAYMLIPCDENHPDIEGCDYSLVEGSTVAASRAAVTPQKELTPQEINRIRDLLMNRHRGFMPRTLGSGG